MAIMQGEGMAMAGTQLLGMAIGRRTDFLHVMTVQDLLAHRTWDLTRVDMVSSAGRPLPQRPRSLSSLDLGETPAAEVYRARLVAVCHTLADRIDREPGLAPFTSGVDQLRTISGTLPGMMALFVNPVLGGAAAGEVDPTDRGGFWHNLWHKAFD